MATSLHNLSDYDTQAVPDASNMCFGIVVSEWNKEITGALLEGTVNTLEKHGTLPENIHVKTVPGSFELVYGAHQMTLNGGYDAIIILVRLHLSRCYSRHRPSERNQRDSRRIWSPHHRQPATG